jgi:hypothetical protein
VWSVWSNSVDIYVSSTCSLLQVGEHPAIGLSYPATLPLDKVLALIGETLQAQKMRFRRTKFKVIIGSQICPPISFLAPSGLKNREELQLLARAVASQSLGVEAQALQCEWGASSPSMIAALPLWWIQSLNSWARAENADIVSMKPIWSWATQCVAAQIERVDCLWLSEEDGVSVLFSSKGHAKSSPTTTMECMRFDAMVEALAWTSTRGCRVEDTIKMRFAPTASNNTAGMPRVFKSHWSLL